MSNAEITILANVKTTPETPSLDNSTTPVNSKALLQHAAFRIAVRERELRLLLHPNLKNERQRSGSVPVATTYGALQQDMASPRTGTPGELPS